MERRTYTGETLAQALIEMKADLGPDAFLISHKKVVRGGVMGLFGRQVVEVTGERLPTWMRKEKRRSSPGRRPMNDDISKIVMAAVEAKRRKAIEPGDDPIEKRVSSDRFVPNYGARAAANESAPALTKSPGYSLASVARRSRVTDTRKETETGGEEIREIKKELGEMRRDLSRLLGGMKTESGPEPAEPLGEETTRLVRAGFSRELASEITRAVAERTGEGEEELIGARIRREIAKRCDVARPPAFDPSRPTVIMAVGPTGVGKTTTLAKLGAIFAVDEKMSVGFVTLDNYRIAAVEQLRTYSEIIGVPLETANSNDELPEAVSRLRDREVILVDTAGRSPYDSEALAEMKRAIFASGPETETYLLISATTAPDDLDTIIERFHFTPDMKVIFTKTDETERLGHLIEKVSMRGIQTAYITTGQVVPSDIEPASADALARRVFPS